MAVLQGHRFGQRFDERRSSLSRSSLSIRRRRASERTSSSKAMPVTNSASSVIAIRMKLSRRHFCKAPAPAIVCGSVAASRRAAWYDVATLYATGSASAADSSTNSATQRRAWGDGRAWTVVGAVMGRLNRHKAAQLDHAIDGQLQQFRQMSRIALHCREQCLLPAGQAMTVLLRDHGFMGQEVGDLAQVTETARRLQAGQQSRYVRSLHESVVGLRAPEIRGHLCERTSCRLGHPGDRFGQHRQRHHALMQRSAVLHVEGDHRRRVAERAGQEHGGARHARDPILFQLGHERIDRDRVGQQAGRHRRRATMPAVHQNIHQNRQHQWNVAAFADLEHVRQEECAIDDQKGAGHCRARRKVPLPHFAHRDKQQRAGHQHRGRHRDAVGRGQVVRLPEGQHQPQRNRHQDPVHRRHIDPAIALLRRLGHLQAGHPAEHDRLASHRKCAGDDRLAGDHGGERGQGDQRQQQRFRAEAIEDVAVDRLARDGDGCLSRVVEYQAGKHDGRPGELDRPRAEMTHVGVQRLGACHAQEHATEHERAGCAAVQQEVQADQRVQRIQYRRMPDQSPQPEQRHRREPQRHHRTEGAPDARGSLRLQREQRAQNDHRRRQHVRTELRHRDLEPFERRQHRDGGRDGTVAVDQRDGAITPAISVLSALEGLEIAVPQLGPYVLPSTVVVLGALFALQPQGTTRIGRAFGPVMALWFAAMALLGLWGLVRHPSVLYALNPLVGLDFLLHSGATGFLVLGGVFLCVTGAEALYADMGHFGAGPIKLAWSAIVFPSLILNYAGQAAIAVSGEPINGNIFYRLCPEALLLPLVALATLATVIASQSIITGAFSMTRQAIVLGWMPRLKVTQTSEQGYGRIYVAAVNWILMAVTLGLVLAFRKSDNLAAAYGIAVSATMLMTSALLFIAMREVWQWNLAASAAVAGAFLIVDCAFFLSNMLKIGEGGYVPLMLAILVYVLMYCWHRGTTAVAARLLANPIPIDSFMAKLEQDRVARVPGTAVFLTRSLS